mgnify:CR=1 FL=1
MGGKELTDYPGDELWSILPPGHHHDELTPDETIVDDLDALLSVIWTTCYAFGGALVFARLLSLLIGGWAS